MKPYNNGWLINDVEFLTQEITDDDAEKMELALDGVMEDNADVEQMEDIRDIFLKRPMRFHVVKQAVWPTQHGHIHSFECDCRNYYFHGVMRRHTCNTGTSYGSWVKKKPTILRPLRKTRSIMR
jgi:hypothetical protein